MKKRVIFAIFALIILIVAGAAVYFTFFFSRKCMDIGCFNANLEKCNKANFLDDIKDAVWNYDIKGENNGQCEVGVKLINMKGGNLDLLPLEGKEMTCYLPLGFVSSPQEDLLKCHGMLKEEMQGVIITRLHNYVLSNIGKISEELKKPL